MPAVRRLDKMTDTARSFVWLGITAGWMQPGSVEMRWLPVWWANVKPQSNRTHSSFFQGMESGVACPVKGLGGGKR